MDSDRLNLFQSVAITFMSKGKVIGGLLTSGLLFAGIFAGRKVVAVKKAK